MGRIGQGSSVQLMLVVIVVAVFSTFLFVTQSTTTAENIGTFAETITGFDSRVHLLRAYDLSYVVPAEENPGMMAVLAHGCDYGKPVRGYRYVVSEQEPVIFEPELYLEEVLNSTVTGNYYFYMDCNETISGGKRLEAGIEPPEDAPVQVASIDVPLPEGNRTEAFLYRWR